MLQRDVKIDGCILQLIFSAATVHLPAVNCSSMHSHGVVVMHEFAELSANSSLPPVGGNCACSQSYRHTGQVRRSPLLISGTPGTGRHKTSCWWSAGSHLKSEK